jgi:formylmethanofuran--tetrahydromethanopterin N-formyltransferase
LKLGDTEIDDTFAEAFDMRCAMLICTAQDEHWLHAAVNEFCGYGSSVIACDAEAGVERWLGASETPDGRVGASVMLFCRNKEQLSKSVAGRAGQCLMTCPTVNVFDGLPEAEERLPLGKHIRFFGDGFQKSKQVGTVRYWRIPVMDGECLLVDRVGTVKGVAGGNLIIQGRTQAIALQAARAAAAAIHQGTGVITPFPGGVVRSGSKVGSKYKGLVASTADAYCPTLRGRVESKLHAEASAAYEIVLDGLNFDVVAQAMTVAMQAASAAGALCITAGNYGGKLGRHQFHLRPLLSGYSATAKI